MSVVDDLADGLANVSLTSTSKKGPHPSLASMLSLGSKSKLPVVGDGNCAYHAVAASLPEAHLLALGFWSVERGGRSNSDQRLQLALRARVVEWLKLTTSEKHRFVGSGDSTWDEKAERWVSPPPPTASSMDRHANDGTYAEMPQLRALAEVLRCCIVSLDSRALFDRVPTFACGQRQTLKLKSWREVAPAIAAGESLADDLPTIVIINNGCVGPGSHFDGTR